MYTSIKALILAISSYYNNNNIFQAYQNGFVVPTDSIFVMMTELDTTSMALMPEITYDVIDEIKVIDQLDSSDFQVDFYGVNARIEAAQFRLILQAPSGSNYLYYNYGYTVHEVSKLINLTNILDRRNYTPRFCVRFSLFNNNVTQGTEYSFDTDTVDLRLAEIQIE